jgi:hypothetical protein
VSARILAPEGGEQVMEARALALYGHRLPVHPWGIAVRREDKMRPLRALHLFALLLTTRPAWAEGGLDQRYVFHVTGMTRPLLGDR